MNERRIDPRSRHTWHGTVCKHCGMTRHKVPTTSQRGCFGYHHFDRTVYRTADGSQAGRFGDDPNKVPPCWPPCTSCGERRFHREDCPEINPK